eukprot:gene38029-biopygen108647
MWLWQYAVAVLRRCVATRRYASLCVNASLRRCVVVSLAFPLSPGRAWKCSPCPRGGLPKGGARRTPLYISTAETELRATRRARRGMGTERWAPGPVGHPGRHQSGRGATPTGMGVRAVARGEDARPRARGAT